MTVPHMASDTHQNGLAALKSLSVAVVGAGAAGLVAARELQREGHRVTVLEQGRGVGGVWAYVDEVEPDLLGRDPARKRVHSSMYAGLRTNLPREVMSFADFPFHPDAMAGRSTDPRQYCSHTEVQEYLEAFADVHGLRALIQYHTDVQEVVPVSSQAVANDDLPWPQWQVTTAPYDDVKGRAMHERRSKVYDAVVVCNGHFREPRLPAMPGEDSFPGCLMHSHNYRRPDSFAGQTVAVLGAGSSGIDICREVAEHAAKVFLCARSYTDSEAGPVGHQQNIWLRPPITKLQPDGSVLLADGSALRNVHTVMYCTGYLYNMPFLKAAKVVDIRENRVAPLYQHIFPPSAAPTLAVVGLPWKVAPFPLFELQSKWVARVLSGRSRLPPQNELESAISLFYQRLEADGIPVRFTHCMAQDLQWEYEQWLSQQCGPDMPELPSWRRGLYKAAEAGKKADPDGYRDTPLDAKLVQSAHADWRHLLQQRPQPFRVQDATIQEPLLTAG